MRILTFTLLIVICCFYAGAQERGGIAIKKDPHKHFRKRTSKDCPVFYITTSTGVNNNTSFLGVNFDKPVAKFVSVEGGLGIGIWGYKFYGGCKYYFNPCHRGWAIGSGLTYSTGSNNYPYTLSTVSGRQTVLLNLHPQTNAFIACYHFWTLGKRANRIYAEAGWSLPLIQGNKFKQVYGDPITSASSDSFNRLSPGGPVAGVGFSFGKF